MIGAGQYVLDQLVATLPVLGSRRGGFSICQNSGPRGRETEVPAIDQQGDQLIGCCVSGRRSGKVNRDSLEFSEVSVLECPPECGAACGF